MQFDQNTHPTVTPQQWQILVQAAQDKERLAELFNEHRDRLKRIVGSSIDHRLNSRMDASDVLQETFMEAFSRILALHRQGHAPDIEEYCLGYPEFALRIRNLFPTLLMVEQCGQRARLADWLTNFRENPAQMQAAFLNPTRERGILLLVPRLRVGL